MTTPTAEPGIVEELVRRFVSNRRMKLDNYQTDGFFDEMFDGEGRPRPSAEELVRRLETLSEGELQRRQKAADLTLLNMGITFSVYGHSAGTEKVWPFDLIPRIVDSAEWKFIERGLKQRITALNLFIDDIYHDAKIVRDGIVPDELIRHAQCFLPPAPA